MTAIWVGAAPQNFGNGRGGVAVDRVVVHWTTASLDSTITHFNSPGAQVSAHFIIDRDGLLYQCVWDGDTAYHAGDFPMNRRSIGIEHVGGPQYDGFTEEQYATSADLIRELSEKFLFPIDRTHVIGHREVIATQCPGVLDIERIVLGDDMTPEQEARVITALNAHTDAKFNELYEVIKAVTRRQMRGAEPFQAGHDLPIMAGEHVFPDHAV